MNPSLERFGLRVMSGEARGAGPALLRGALAVAEPLYAGAMMARNRLYDAGVFATYALPKPTISVGNLTTGGTGKTPVVRWMAEQLIARGKHPAILLRGYRVGGAAHSDEQQLLQSQLNRDGPAVAVVADPDRRAGAATALQLQPRTNVFLLDDAFQHRKVARDFNLVLINAAEPFGFGRVFPRGLLREPLRGLRRADAVLITRADAVDTSRLETIEAKIRSLHATAPVFRTEHALTGLRHPGGAVEPMSRLRGRRFFSFSGIGSPDSFHAQLTRAGGVPVGSRWFPDHHAYIEADVAQLARDASSAGAEFLLTTEKDWVKLAPIEAAPAMTPPILRVEMRIHFQRAEDEAALIDAIEQRIAARH
ncbi:MAG: tetraacyldisaccharide 4'-kinase [Tepidisphaeraceae bacterium]